MLKPFFKHIEKKEYKDSLLINQAQPLIDYIMSCHGNQNELIGPRMEEFKTYIQEIIENNGSIFVSKQAGILLCR